MLKIDKNKIVQVILLIVLIFMRYKQTIKNTVN